MGRGWYPYIWFYREMFFIRCWHLRLGPFLIGRWLDPSDDLCGMRRGFFIGNRSIWRGKLVR